MLTATHLSAATYCGYDDPNYCPQEADLLRATYHKVKVAGSHPADTIQGIVTHYHFVGTDLTQEAPVVLAELEGPAPMHVSHRQA